MTDLGFVHRYVPSPGGSPLTLLLLHGTGGNEDDLLQLGRQVSPGASLLSPRGRVLENGMPRFFRRLSEGVFDVEDISLQTQSLAQFVLAASKEYRLRADRVVALGYSNAANIAGSTLMLRPDVLAGAILLRPMVPFMPDRMPSLRGKPTFVLAGTRDSIVPREQTERLASLLEGAGADVSLHWADSGHGIGGGEVVAARDWLSDRFPSGA